MTDRLTNLFIELLKVTVGTRVSLSSEPSEKEWAALFALSRRQAIAAAVLDGVGRLPEAQRPPQSVLLQWCAVGAMTEDRNAEVNRAATDLTAKVGAAGFDSCILKGQGVALYYPNPLSRQCGDIDIWLGGGDKRVIEYVRSLAPKTKAIYHHIEAPQFDGVEVEVHYRPSYFRSPFTNRRLQKWAGEQFPAQVAHKVILPGQSAEVSVPTKEFNLIYILLHIYTHFFQEGIGLRQMMDYYYVLMSGITPAQKEEAVRVIKEFRMTRFASAVMYVLQQVFGLSEDYFLVPADSRDGEILLEEIMRVGNFGQYDPRNIKKRGHSALYKGWMNILRDLQYIRMSPSEVLWLPYFKIWHLFWRRAHNN